MITPSPDCILIASFDIGKCNFSFCIEEVNLKKLKKITNIPKDKRFFKNGEMTPEYAKIISKVREAGKILLLENTNLTDGCNKKKYFDPKTCINMTDLLDSYQEYWNACSVFSIEMQMAGFGKAKVVNTMAIKLAQHCASYFMFYYRDFKKIIEFPAYHKTQVLGAKKIEAVKKNGKISYKVMDKPARKKWAIQEALKILEARGDVEFFNKVKGAKKADDMADTVLMNIAYTYLACIDKVI